MTDPTLKKLSRKELLEVMLSQSKEIEKLQEQLRVANEKLASREICIQQSGSMAEAALKLNQVFQAADAASQQYLESIQKMAQQEQETLARLQAKEQQLQAALDKVSGKKEPSSSPEPVPFEWEG
jgi:light-regulated signal transduction histidine kinase (bacteriophytochrome)